MANFGKKPDKSTYENGYIKDGEFTKILRMAVDGKNYFAEKKFTEDAKYRADCRWNDDTNTEYTLMPSGLVSGDNIDTSHYRYISTDKNVTRHEREYHIHMTTYEGTYETHWYIKGIGEKVNGSERGRFDSFLEENGSTCSVELGETPAEGGLMTCTLKIEDFTVGTRYCPPVTTTNYGDCTPEETLIPALMFKIIDPENPFPNTTMTTYGYTDQKSGETYAYNWVTEEGQNVMNQILTKAPGNNTYHPDNIPAENGTFELSPKTVIAIQEYNAKSRRFGSYTDFTLTCECPDPPTIMTEENNQMRKWVELSPEEKQGFCGNCKSDFLTKLNEFITSGNQTTITYPESLGDAE
jgi:hypothetical protein